MKRLIISMIVTIFTLGLFAQSKPIDVTTIQGDGYTYIKETRKSRLVDLYNQETYNFVDSLLGVCFSALHLHIYYSL